MYVLEHPALTSIHADTLQSRVDWVARGNIAHPSMAKAGVAGLELRCGIRLDFLRRLPICVECPQATGFDRGERLAVAISPEQTWAYST
jgi:hypothetical protein